MGAPWLVWGHPSWYVGLPWMECGGHLTGRGTLAGMCSSLTRVGVPWLLCEVKLTGVGGTLVGVGGTLLGVRVPWLARGHPGWCAQFPGFCGGGVPWLLRQGDTLAGMWGAPWYVGGTLAGVLVPSFHKGRQNGSGEEQYFDPGRGISVGRRGCRQGLHLVAWAPLEDSSPPSTI